MVNIFSFIRRNVEDSDDDDRSPSSEDIQSYSNPIRDDSDIKAKMSEMNEEKRTKLREIEVGYRCHVIKCDLFYY